jgi:hypothetical protein
MTKTVEFFTSASGISGVLAIWESFHLMYLMALPILTESGLELSRNLTEKHTPFTFFSSILAKAFIMKKKEIHHTHPRAEKPDRKKHIPF